MDKASKVMYSIGKVFNVIEIIMAGLAIIGGIIALSNPMMFNNMQVAPEQIKAVAIALIVGGIIALLVSIIVLTLATNAQNTLNDGVTENTPHIIMIVIGILSTDIFYTLGGIFGIVSENNNK